MSLRITSCASTIDPIQTDTGRETEPLMYKGSVFMPRGKCKRDMREKGVRRKALAAAFPHTLPILAGFGFPVSYTNLTMPRTSRV